MEQLEALQRIVERQIIALQRMLESCGAGELLRIQTKLESMYWVRKEIQALLSKKDTQ